LGLELRAPAVFHRQSRGGRPQRLLGRPDRKTKQTLQSFGINRGGYIGFFNPETGDDETFALRGDARAKRRLKVKSRATLTRRSMRYKLGTLAADRLAEAGQVEATERGGRQVASGLAVAPKAKRRALAVEMLDCSEDRKAARA
jgi:hypothetical protein